MSALPTPLASLMAYVERESARRAKGSHPGMMRLDDAELAALLDVLQRVAETTFRPIPIPEGSTGRAAEAVAGEMVEHLRQRVARNGALDAAVVAEGGMLGGLRFLGEVAGHAAVVDRLKFWLGQAEAMAAFSSVPAGTVLQ